MLKATGFIIMITYGQSSPVPLPTPYGDDVSSSKRYQIYTLEECEARKKTFTWDIPTAHCIPVRWEEIQK